MVVSAVLLIGHSDSAVSTVGASTANTRFATDIPLACQEILGESVLGRTITRLQNAGVKSISIVVANEFADVVTQLSRKYHAINLVRSSWPSTSDLAGQFGTADRRILVIRVGAYIEFELGDLLQFYEQRREPVVRAHDAQGPLDVWVMDTAQSCDDADMRRLCSEKADPHPVAGYVNRLRNWQDFRSLAMDMLLGRCAAKPRGHETESGLWLAEDTRVHRYAKVVAPAFIGVGTRVRASAVITRYSNVERHCDIGRGALVEDSAILPHTRIGDELHVRRAIVQENQFLDMRNNTMAILNDNRLLSSTLPAPRRALEEPEANHAERPLSQAVGLNHLPYRGGALPRALGFLEDEL